MAASSKNVSRKQVAINMAANIVSYSANIIISFILTPYLINTVGKETYSFYPIANTIVSYMSVLMNAMNAMASRFVTISLVQDKKEDANKYFSSTFAANMLLSIILFVPMTLIVAFLDEFMEVPINSEATIKGLFSFVFSSAIINISASVFGIATFAKNRIDLRSLRELITAVLRLLLFYLLYKFLTPSIIYVGIVAFIVAIVNILFQVTYTRMLLPEITLNKKYVSRTHTFELLSSSCWNAINTFGNTLLAGMSMILANMFYGASSSGSYSIVHTVPQFICGVIVMLVGVFYPVITYRYAQNDKNGLIKEIERAQTLIGLLGCAVISVFSALATEFFMLWTPEENAVYLSQLSFYTIMPHYVIACMWSLTNMNVVMNKVKVPAVYTLISGVMNILTAYIVYKIWSPGLLSLPIISSILQIIWVGIFIPQYVSYNLEVRWYTFYPPLIKALVCSGFTIWIITKIKVLFILDSWIKFMFFGSVAGGLTLIVFVFVMMGYNNVVTMLGRFLIKIRKN